MSKRSMLAMDAIRGVSGMSRAELVKIITGRDEAQGLTPRMKLKIDAAIELGRKTMLCKSAYTGREVHAPEDLTPILLPILGGRTREAFVGIFLSARNQVMAAEVIAEGTVDACVLHPREVFRLVIEKEASGLVLAHNHPSGNPQPSCEDLNLTERFRRIASTMGVKLVDHVIVAGNDIVSIRALGLWDANGDFEDIINSVIQVA